MIAVIGGGPAGLLTASKLAEKGFEVNVYEEHPAIGRPVQCTGLLTRDIESIIKLDKLVINRIGTARIHSAHNHIELDIDDLVIDRMRFDQRLGELAADKGAGISLNHRFIAEGNGLFVKDLRNGKMQKLRPDALIGADGPRSAVAQAAGIYGNRRFMIGRQMRVKGTFDPGTFDAYLDVPGCFGWIVPEDRRTARIGLASSDNARFADFIKRVKKEFRIGKVLGNQGGLIPLYDSRQQLQKGNIYLVGDAALQVKATTGGGLVPGLKAAAKLADSISHGRDYMKSTKSIGKELWLNLQIRKALDRCNAAELDRMIEELESIKHIFRKSSRDNLFSLLLKIVLRKPRLLLYARKMRFGSA